MKNSELLVTSANAPHDLLVCVDVAGNGKSILTATGAEVREGRLIISCEAPTQKEKKDAPTPKAKAAPAQQTPAEPTPAASAPKPEEPAKPAEATTVE